MEQIIHYTQCPACGHSNISPRLSAKDHTVSGKEFAVWHCTNCTLCFTQDVPTEAEIGPYYKADSYISHSDTKKGLINTLYHFVRKQTLVSKRKLLVKETGLLKGAVLDIGCGTGAFLAAMKQAGWGITGLEPDPAAREKATSLYGLVPMPPAELFNLKTESFNAITMWHVLEHVHNLQGYLQQLHHLLAPTGRLVIAVPNYTSMDAVNYGPHWAAWDVPRHLYHFSPQAMEQLLAKNGFTITKYKPMWFDSFYVAMLSEKYRNGKGNLLSAVWQGFLSNLQAWKNVKKCSSVIYIATKK